MDGKEAISRLFDDSPGEYLRIIAGLIPRELLLEISQEEKTNWVINAQPQLAENAWRLRHNLEIPAIEVDQ